MEDLLARLKMPPASTSPGVQDSPRSPPASTIHQPQPQSLAHGDPLLASQSLTPNPNDKATSDRATNLLNLLKFNSPASPKPATGPPAGEAGAMESSVKPGLGQARIDLPSSPQVLSGRNAASPASNNFGNSQNALLSLLNRAQAQASSPGPAIDSSLGNSNGKVSVPGMEEKIPTDSASPLASSLKEPVFTYVNPFDQLAASSPLNRTSKPENEIPSSQFDSRQDGDQVQKLSSPGHKSTDSSDPPLLPDGRTRIEAIMGIGAPSGIDHKKSDSVTKELGKVAVQADKQAQSALETAEAGPATAITSINDLKPTHPLVKPLPIDRATNEHSGGPFSEATAAKRDTVEEAVEKEEGAAIQVYNFPMRPFVSINIKDSPPSSASIRKSIVMKIASLKKEFDQVDRSLVTATTNFIVYSLVKGGVRVIRQDDGSNQQIFRQHGQNMFNLSIRSSGKENDSDVILATAINGSVYCTSAPSSNEAFEGQSLDQNGFIFPPLPSSDENTSGGQLKTRAKQSSRSPELFAIGRGKSIHIVQASMASAPPYINEQNRIVNTEKYLADRCLKIATGKAGKDFAFSDDDSLIVSLDKAGRLKFWDIRNHLEAARVTPVGRSVSVEVKIPTMILETSSPSDKSWATSVQFVDKEKPFLKGAAIRYLLVGLKQNHTLQLWDLCLGKPVQELNLPHENETDAICSIGYHAKSGIITIGHPTRNSIYLIHFSAPRYNLPAMCQAEFTRRLVSDDQKLLPRPESTAIMSGVREISLSEIGQLRSLEVLHPTATTEAEADKEDETIFEIYAMHSRGVGCFSIKPQDLGWDKDGKVLMPLDGEKEGRISVRPLQAISQPVDGNDQSERESSTSKQTKPDTSTLPFRSTATPNVQPPNLSPTENPDLAKTSSVSSTDPHSDKKKKKKKSTEFEKPVEMPKEVPPETYAAATQRGISAAASAKDVLSTSIKPSSAEAKAASSTADEMPKVDKMSSLPENVKDPSFATALGDTLFSAIGNTLSTVLADVLGDQLQGLYERLDKARRIQDATAAANQDAILRLVSSTLTDNVEKNLARIVNSAIKDSVIPTLTSTVASTLDQKLSGSIASQLNSTIPREVKLSMPGAIGKAIQEPELLRNVSESITSKLTSHVEKEFTSTLKNNISPAFQNLAIDTAQKISSEVEENARQQLHGIDIQSKADSAKINSLVDLVGQMSSTIQAMATAQVELRNEFNKLQSEVASLRAVEPAALQPKQSDPAAAGPKDEEAAAIAALMGAARFEEATIQWLSSGRQEDLWNILFVQLDPAYLEHVNQIVTLSVAATVSSTFDTDIIQRLTWLESALACIDTQNSDISEYAPRIMDVLTSRLQEAYMQISQSSPSDPSLARIHSLVRQAKEIKQSATA